MKKIRFETTPNPNAIKCVIPPDPDTTKPRDIRSYFNADQVVPAQDPLAAALFAIPGVTNLLIHTAFITVGKSPDAQWPALKRRIKAVLEHA